MFWWCVSLCDCKFTDFSCVSSSFSFLLRLNKKFIKVEFIWFVVLYLEVLFNFLCFQLSEEDSWKPLSLFNPSPVWAIHFIQIWSVKTISFLSPFSSLQNWSFPRPKIFLSLCFQQNPQNKIKNYFTNIPSLKSAFISSHLKPHWSFLRDWKGESPLPIW